MKQIKTGEISLNMCFMKGGYFEEFMRVKEKTLNSKAVSKLLTGGVLVCPTHLNKRNI